TFPALSLKTIVGMLSVLGATNKRVRGNFQEQSRWVLPAATFDPSQYLNCREQENPDGRD
ncbi:MAG: hypothetical protein ABI822_33955, partial [Bryobacteraceae bacterium]